MNNCNGNFRPGAGGGNESYLEPVNFQIAPQRKPPSLPIHLGLAAIGLSLMLSARVSLGVVPTALTLSLHRGGEPPPPHSARATTMEPAAKQSGWGPRASRSPGHLQPSPNVRASCLGKSASLLFGTVARKMPTIFSPQVGTRPATH